MQSRRTAHRAHIPAPNETSSKERRKQTCAVGPHRQRGPSRTLNAGTVPGDRLR